MRRLVGVSFRMSLALLFSSVWLCREQEAEEEVEGGGERERERNTQTEWSTGREEEGIS